MTPADVVRSFVGGPEFQAANTDNAVFLTNLYNGIMGRAPDPGGMAYWLAVIAADPVNGRQAVPDSFLAGQELADLCAAFGL